MMFSSGSSKVLKVHTEYLHSGGATILGEANNVSFFVMCSKIHWNMVVPPDSTTRRAALCGCKRHTSCCSGEKCRGIRCSCTGGTWHEQDFCATEAFGSNSERPPCAMEAFGSNSERHLSAMEAFGANSDEKLNSMSKCTVTHCSTFGKLHTSNRTTGSRGASLAHRRATIITTVACVMPSLCVSNHRRCQTWLSSRDHSR